LFLAKKNLSARGILIEINNVIETSTVTHSTTILYLWKRSFLQPSEVPLEYREIERVDSIDAIIVKALDETLFASLREFAKRILIMITTIRYHLANLI
jgi:hypothetical protein